MSISLLRSAGFCLLMLAGVSCQSQPVPKELATSYSPLNEKLARTISADEYAISPTTAQGLDAPIYLDARETEEYQVSHLPGAVMIGYDRPNYKLLDGFAQDRPVVVYCTIGYRSERIAKKLRERGFEKVYNLYGSIYAWSLAGLPLEDAKGQPTERVHTYNKKWGSYLPESVEKVY
ncbi:hypothetical protein CEQ90_07405 [Lewinellaceae bacterium SD302]|nr:hypothetical protein CEQ90_07405 [Lewinellaceae bacterium SD302]